MTVVDTNPGLVRRITEAYDVSGVAGFASHPDVLERAGARDADMVIAATQSDEVNMVICQVAHSIFSVPRKIARLRSQAYLTAIYSDLYRHRRAADRRGDLAGIRGRRRGDAAPDRPGRLRHRRLSRRRRAADRHHARRGLRGAEHAAASALGAVLDAARSGVLSTAHAPSRRSLGATVELTYVEGGRGGEALQRGFGDFSG